ncbi:cation:proton antiporter [uncultured Azohydromonas sp.]|uniref:cation:proton antiporter n=1 Tax=uncultured Azohydromonas sp. TaxID=487342 RepID=UPI00263660C4|nr:cation:proton antiporter [uncultured Azohydromonas sp.]
MDTFEQFFAATELGWPLLLALAWLVGELGHRWTKLPRISLYALVGFACAQLGGALLPAAGDSTGMLLANISFGLILFEFGYRINLRWLRINPWLGASGVFEAAVTGAAVYLLSRAWGAPILTSLLLASLSMSTSPAAIMRVVNEQRSAGQVTERVLHLTALNCVLSVFVFKVVVGFWAFDSSGNAWQAVSSSVLVLVGSAALGIAFGTGMPALLRSLGPLGRDATVAFAVAVILLVGIAQAFKLSPLLAALAFGLAARHRRVALTQTQRNFGALGELLAVALFTYTAMAVEWPRVMAGLGLALALVAVRLAAKVLCVTALARASGISWRKGALTGLALTPISVFVILLLDQTRYLGIDLLDQLAPLAAATLLLELAGPVVTQYALRRAGECRESEEA